MNDLIPRFSHLMEQILQKLDNEGLAKSREVARSWQNVIDMKNYLWLRIVKIPTLLNEGNTYLHLAAKHSQIDMLKVILDSEADQNLVNDNCYTPFLDLSRKTRNGFTPFLLACISGNSQLLELIMKNSDELKILQHAYKPIAIFQNDKMHKLQIREYAE